MKKCSGCGTPWGGFGSQPREREACPTCRRYYRCCANCRHFDARSSSQCTLRNTQYVGPRDVLNYCPEFQMTDSLEVARQTKISLARSRWDQLFAK